jgi:hypothetical protein
MNMGTAEHEHDQRSAHVAAGMGMDGSLRLLMEARSAGITQSLALALRQQETGIEGDGNVFGHDRGKPFAGAGRVTKAKYLEYRRVRGSHGQGGMQGVGPLQLTYYTFQDRADALGGCWLPKHNYRVGFEDLAHLIRMDGTRRGLAVYNGGTVRPNFDYADSVLRHQRFWHEKLS